MEVDAMPRSWQEAFENHPIASVRVFEKQLRAGVTRDQEKLRALVGGNYRELLSTAEEIVRLEQHTRKAEVQIAELGQQCKPSQFEDSTQHGSGHTAALAQLKFLAECVLCGVTALRRDSVLLTAQLVVVSLLLVKSLTALKNSPGSIEHLRIRVVKLKRRLLRRIDVLLVQPKTGVLAMVQGICAYCLVTSASSSEALKHFRYLRLEKLRDRLESCTGTEGLRNNCRYFVISGQAIMTLLGRPVNDVLNSMQKRPILEDPSITKLDTLDLDSARDLVPKDIMSFTPYIKRVSLSKQESQTVVKEWSTKAGSLINDGIRGFAAGINHVNHLLDLRKTILDILLPVCFSSLAYEKMIPTLSRTLDRRVIELCQEQVKAALSVGERLVLIKATDPANSLWDASFAQTSVHRNNTKYLNEVQYRHQGAQGELRQGLKQLRSWAMQIHKMRDYVISMQQTRWQDVIEEPDMEDDDSAQVIVTHLSKDSPQEYMRAIDTALTELLSRYTEMVSEAVASTRQNSSTDPHRTISLLRIIRESSTILRLVFPNGDLNGLSQMAPTLHATLAEHITQVMVEHLRKQGGPRAQSSDGLKDLPSPEAFLVLRQLSNLMAELGGVDIWSSAAVIAIKTAISRELFSGDSSEVLTFGDFDREYLQAAFSYSKNQTDAVKQRTTGAAYWDRTKLLFGILS